MIAEINNNNPLNHIFSNKTGSSPFNKMDHDSSGINSPKNYTSPALPKNKPIPKTPALFIVYRFAPGSRHTSVSIEFNERFNFLNQIA